jgi:4-diphosphocytidyl-2-C-methyl-D-erythritol kinase
VTRAPAAVAAPAKINFGLRVVGRRVDGYHELDSVFLPLDLVDEVWLEPAPGGLALALAGDAPGVPEDDRNLAVRAARAFAEAAGLGADPDLRLGLRKSIPAAAGLGGGSSDAGAVLRALAALHPGRVAPERLRALALGLGADVPFFLDPRPARVTGVGERIEPLAGVPALWLLLASPGLPLATAEVYRAFDALAPALTPADPASTVRALRALAEAGGDPARLPRGVLEAALRNDLEPSAARLCPPVPRLRARLGALGAPGVGLSGSGPTLYGVFADRAAAERAAEALRPAAPAWARVARTLASP